MAMIKCRECEREISNKAEKCPHCGFPLSKKSKENKKTNVLGTVLGIIILIIGLSMWLGGTSEMLETSSQSSYSKSSSKITLEKFNQIQTGMTYEEVVEIIGEEGTVLSEVDMDIGEEYKTIIYYWYGSDGISNSNITFQGNKVVAKSQIGLD